VGGARAALVLLLAAGCGPSPVASPSPSPSLLPGPRYTAVLTILENPEHAAELCAGGVDESLPPQCGGVPVTPFSWDDVEGEQSVGGTTWLDAVRVVGSFYGTDKTFHLTEKPVAVAPPAPSPGRVDLATPCADPGGVTDRSRTSDGDREAAIASARKQPDVAGVWLDGAVLNLAFTGDLERHEREARSQWGGPLCVSRLPRTYASLERTNERIFAAAERAVAEEAGVYVYAGAVREDRNDVEVSVLVADDVTRRWMADHYGGVVVLRPIFQPVP